MVKGKLNLKKIKKILLEQKEAIEKEFSSSSLVVNEGTNSFADANDLATHDTDLSNDLNVKQIKSSKYNEIIRALDRIETDEFGICEECGSEISPKRLEVYPTSRMCIVCQEEHEKTQKAKGLIGSSNVAQ